MKKSTHQKEESTHQTEKSTHQKEKSTHPIYNNPYYSNPDFIDTHSINQSSACADGMNDGLQNIKKKISFSEMLKAIGYNDGYSDYIPEDESFFGNAEESERKIDHCTLPYWLTKNQQAMREALKFVLPSLTLCKCTAPMLLPTPKVRFYWSAAKCSKRQDIK